MIFFLFQIEIEGKGGWIIGGGGGGGGGTKGYVGPPPPSQIIGPPPLPTPMLLYGKLYDVERFAIFKNPFPLLSAWCMTQYMHSVG